ncbi:MAG: TIGR03620 family F420-dependent LLM class oxidoreductase [Solirubrobacterales bacterium]|nr:TIGR03620 family F420-dependent LLM class oxidoreductase [Solirubrobacterales bacterium]
MELGSIGLWTTDRAIGEGNAAEAAQLAEELGYGTLWLGGSPPPSAVRPLLAATERLIVATGITNVWADDPERVAAETAELADAFGDRFLLGVGIGHPEATSDYARPLTAMRRYLDGLDGAPRPVPADRRCLAALGPKMLDLSAERSLGTHPYFTPPEHTRFARQRVGAALVAPELACVLDTDATRARETAREYARRYLGLSNYTSNLLRFGFDESDLQHGGSDRLIDAVVPQGSAERLAAAVGAHLDAGADHVCVQTVGVRGVPAGEWSELAAVLGLH